ncbi:unnamed protein product [Calicophoron daubneyi]|uniref:Nose resistant-to-fluoxetine protein N-terminal domain-containing protein n=1 Tax=Calicophoron daubneyi TaxID=300641 RepID=A0AAV2TMF9_CALDB
MFSEKNVLFSAIFLLSLVVHGQILTFENELAYLIALSKIPKDELHDNSHQIAKIGVSSLVYRNIRPNSGNRACDEDLWAIVLGALRNDSWATPWLDACAKPPPGIDEGALHWYGSFELCMKNIYKPDVNGTSLGGRYCKVSFPIGGQSGSLMQAGLDVGLCVPESCNTKDVVKVINTALQNFQFNASLTSSICYLKADEKEKDAWFWGSIALCVAVGLLLVAGSLTEAVLYIRWIGIYSPELKIRTRTRQPAEKEEQEEEEDEDGSERFEPVKKDVEEGVGVAVIPYTVYRKNCIQQNRALVVPCAYSLPYNAWKIWSTPGPKVVGPDGSLRDHPLTCLNGIRTLSMLWVIFGHCAIFIALTSNNIKTALEHILNRWTYEVLVSATVSVDVFFFLSGLLSTYLTLNGYRRTIGWVQKTRFWTVYVIHRFVRLTPLYMFVVIIYTGLFAHLYEGPFYPIDITASDLRNCRNTWYISYLGNLVRAREMCCAWSWYLANDFQFSIVLAPIFISLIALSWIAGVVFAGLLVVSSAVTYCWLSYANNFGLLPMKEHWFDDLYVKPYSRWGTYAIGMLLGWILLDHPRLPLRRTSSNRILVPFIGVTISTILCLAVVYGPFELAKVDITSPKFLEASIYTAFSRPGFIIGVAIIVFLCVTGWAEPYRLVLSWSGFRIPARLTYGAYMIHLAIIYYCVSATKAAFIYDELFLVTFFLSMIVLAYLGSFVLSVLTESPVMAIEKYLRESA